MEDFKEFLCTVCACVPIIFLIIGLAFMLVLLGFNVGYKKCAADFYEGKVGVELVEHANGERTWEWKDND